MGQRPSKNSIQDLTQSTIAELRRRYLQVYGRSPPPALGPDLLRKSISHEIQCRTKGGLPPSTAKRLNELVRAFEEKPHAKLQVARKIKLGSEFARTWKGKMHRVIVVADGYAYAGRTYRSLSEIARLIAGSRWNGPRFFGLRGKAPNVG
ncbi:MAG: DUF2924 domain-containing protein [Rhizobiales bacterium]|nr:DUF2924 domain-containing protein [Hyphomicrobiales bacterium]